jgi:hypothetical protein
MIVKYFIIIKLCTFDAIVNILCIAVERKDTSRGFGISPTSIFGMLESKRTTVHELGGKLSFSIVQEERSCKA